MDINIRFIATEEWIELAFNFVRPWNSCEITTDLYFLRGIYRLFLVFFKVYGSLKQTSSRISFCLRYVDVFRQNDFRSSEVLIDFFNNCLFDDEIDF